MGYLVPYKTLRRLLVQYKPLCLSRQESWGRTGVSPHLTHPTDGLALPLIQVEGHPGEGGVIDRKQPACNFSLAPD